MLSISRSAWWARCLPWLGVVILALCAVPATAQTTPPAPAPPLPQPLAQQYQASTPVALTQYSERPNAKRPTVPSQFIANISAGTTLAGGNTKTYAGTIGGRFLLLKQPHQLSLDVMGTYSAVRNEETRRMVDTAKNIIGRARYDFFTSKSNAVFAALQPRRDKFAGLDLRLQTQAGYLRNLYVPRDNHRLWGEVGYDGTYDNFTPFEPPGAPPRMVKLPKSDFVHSGRVFVGYMNQLTPLATVNLGVELLVDFEVKDNTRVNSMLELTSSLSQHFKMSLLSRIFYDQLPVAGKQETDYITTAQLVYTFDSVSPPPICPVCTCAAEIAAAKRSCAQPGPAGKSAPLASPADEPVGEEPVQTSPQGGVPPSSARPAVP